MLRIVPLVRNPSNRALDIVRGLIMSVQSIPSWRAAGATLALALLFSIVGWSTLSHSAFAQSEQPMDALAAITVNTTNPAIADDGQCSIIEAIENANADAALHDDCVAGSGNDTISLPADALMVFTTTHNGVDGGNALPVITTTITILGNGATLARNTSIAPNFRFFKIVASGNLTINELALRNGYAGLISTLVFPQSGGAILNAGTLNVINSNLSFNRATYGGAIYSEVITGSLTVNGSTFSSNIADQEGGALFNIGPAVISNTLLRFNQATAGGGAIVHESSTMSMTSSTVQDNTSAGSGAGIVARSLTTDSLLSMLATNVISNVAAINGGGLYNSASNDLTSIVEIDESNFGANRADSTNLGEGVGGGIVNGWVAGSSGGVAEVQLTESSLLDNVAQEGGGIANVDAAGYPTRTAQVFISQSTLARNTAAGIGSQRGLGGGLFNSNGEATVANSTFSANQAVGDDALLGGRGGGIGNVGRGVTTTLQLLNSTLAYNEATQAGGGIALLGQVTSTATSMEVGNTLVVSNALSATETVSNVAVLAAMASPQVIPGTESCSVESGTSTSLGGNIEDGTACGWATTNDLQSTSVELLPLALNGSDTLTHLITETGAAHDGGLPAICADPPVNGVDQRGVSRPQGEHCDVGAVELLLETGMVTFFPQIYHEIVPGL
jgi:hypothetical protein